MAAKRKKRSFARRRAPESETHPYLLKKTERGMCIFCGEIQEGFPAKADAPVAIARKLRALLRMGTRHTVACKAHIEEARKLRADFLKRLFQYRLAAVIFFLFVAGGSAATGNPDARAILVTAAFSIMVALFPYLKYFPEFQE